MLHDRHHFVVRDDLGWIETGGFDKVLPDLRFFTGNNHSTHGYKYKSISSGGSDGRLKGAFKLTTGSLKYQYSMTGKWQDAIFVDSSKAINDTRRDDFKTDTRVGVRWQSPVESIRLDFTVSVGDKDEHGLQFYISLGPEL